MNQSPFNKELALLLAKLCVESYSPVADYNVNQFNLDLVKAMDNKETDIQGFIAKVEKNLYIVFRGANTFKDYMRDLDAFYKNYPPSKRLFFKPKVHAGFFNGYLSVKDVIVKAITNHPEIEKVYITGHSMGAALAVYCAFDLNMDNKHSDLDITLYTFGCPEVGNGSFVKRFNKAKAIEASYRVVNDEDIVTKINIPGLQHVPTEVLLKDHEIIVNPSNFVKLKETLDDVLTAVTGEAIKDHLSANYVKTLENNQ